MKAKLFDFDTKVKFENDRTVYLPWRKEPIVLDIEQLAKARKWLEKEEIEKGLITFHALKMVSMKKFVKAVHVPSDYIEETGALIKKILSNFTLLIMAFDNESFFRTIMNAVNVWVHVDIVEQNEDQHWFVLEAERHILEDTKSDIEKKIAEWNVMKLMINRIGFLP